MKWKLFAKAIMISLMFWIVPLLAEMQSYFGVCNPENTRYYLFRDSQSGLITPK
ncbi:hypothetical protein SAMN04487897_14618 [Paenibacillus sp. yr247]|uniref:hypothetical protein n=1 Tax=Paenibacillus sp. yr247 TaxID=1761880 RepID=UPI0008871E7F|nr:hypothetical protein [Paenibacillus sp. yr247]SDP20217.1 hypothetical protein SAMN04487897_14618 [Paenibacillus sp. yr247]